MKKIPERTHKLSIARILLKKIDCSGRNWHAPVSKYFRVCAIAAVTVFSCACTITKIPPVSESPATLPELSTSKLGVSAGVSLSEIEKYGLKSFDSVPVKGGGAIPCGTEIGDIDLEKILDAFLASLKIFDTSCGVQYFARIDLLDVKAENIGGVLKIRVTLQVGGHAELKVFWDPLIGGTKDEVVWREKTEPPGVGEFLVSVNGRVGEDYEFVPLLNIESFTWKQKPGIKLFDLIKVSLGGETSEAIRKELPSLTQDVNKAVADNVNIKNDVKKLWKDAHQPILLDKGVPIWLTLEPLGLSATPLYTRGEELRVGVALDGPLTALAGLEPPELAPTELPPLQLVDEIEDFVLNVRARLLYERVVEILQEEWVGETLKTELGNVKFLDFNVYQTSNNQLAVGAYISARSKFLPPLRGWLYFTGSPDIDGDKVMFTNLDYRGDINNPLYIAILWVMSPIVKNELREQLRIDLSKDISSLEKELDKEELELSDDAKGRLSIEEIQLDSVSAGPDSIIIDASARGSAEIELGLTK